MDREKVYKGLESCEKIGRLGMTCEEVDCPYYEDEDNSRLMCWIDVLHDALELLEEQEYEIDQAYKSGYTKGYHDATTKEQEEAEPVFECEEPALKIGQFHCGNCHCSFGISHFRFCPHCGRKVKWK